MTNDQIIALIASLGAFFSALATFLTVRQIAKQREASYRPELVLSHVSVECSKDAIAGGLLPTSWVAKSEDSRGDSPPKTFVIPLRNVGLGTAKSVVVSWSLPFEALVKEVNEMAQRTLSAAYLTFENGSLSIKPESLGNITSIWKN